MSTGINKKVKNHKLVVASDAITRGRGLPLVIAVDVPKSDFNYKSFCRVGARVNNSKDSWGIVIICEIDFRASSVPLITVLPNHPHDALSVSAGDELSVWPDFRMRNFASPN